MVAIEIVFNSVPPRHAPSRNGFSEGATSQFAHVEKFKFTVCNPCQCSPSLTILVPLWFIIISLVFFYLSKLIFSGFFQFKGNFVRGQKKTQNTITELLSSLLEAKVFVNHMTLE